eukprot:m.76858 g.76858  ORF g.76858 m.76858 type:complete len:456 (+) comp12586_c0_seq1:230-1597(+)
MSASEKKSLLPTKGNVQDNDKLERHLPHGGSCFGASINMTKALFGAGVLAMPHAFTQTGFIPGIILYLTLATLVAGSNILLLMVEQEVNVHRHEDHKYNSVATYADVCDILYGKMGRFGAELSVIILQIMFSVGFIIVGLSNMLHLTPWSRWELTLAAVPILMVLSMVRWLAEFWAISFFGLIVYCIGIMGTASYHAIDTMSHDLRHNITIDKGLDADGASSVLFITTALYSIEGICMVLPITNSLKRPDKYSKTVMVTGVMFFGIIVAAYGAISFEGGLGKCPPSMKHGCIITDTLPEGTITTVVRAALVIGLIVSHPVAIYPCAEMLEPRFTEHLGKPMTTVQRWILKWTLVIITAILGYLVPSFNIFSNFGGSLFLPMVAFIMPPALYLKARKKNRKPFTLTSGDIVMAIMLFGSICMGLFMIGGGLYVSIKSLEPVVHNATSNLTGFQEYY